jgi:hypothetical protein
LAGKTKFEILRLPLRRAKSRKIDTAATDDSTISVGAVLLETDYGQCRVRIENAELVEPI